MSSTTLTDWLRARDDEALVAMLRARPDLATPRPADTAVLATRAGTRASVARATEGLDTFTLAVLDALLAAGADKAPVPVGSVDLGDRTGQAIETLRGLLLAWGDDEISLVPAAREAGGPGLGRSAPALADADVPALLAEIGDDERKVLTTLAHGQPVGRTKDAAEVLPLDQARTPVQRLLARGLLLRVDAETVELPREVGLALRPGGDLTEPPLRLSVHKVSTVDATAAGEALEVLRHMETLLRLWSDEPAQSLKSGGLGVRDIRRITKAADIADRQANVLIELAYGASLVAESETGEWVPTNHADTWLSASPANRWATLAAAWLDLPRLPGLAGLRDAKDKLLAPLSDDLRRPVAPLERARVLAVLADLKLGTAVASSDELAAVLAWRAPRRGGRLRDEIVRWTLAEATSLGLVALGALSGPGRALLDEGAAAGAKRMAEAMPDPVDHVLVQADLTVVAPGPLEPHLASQIAEVADVESAGSATVYRLSETSIRRALDVGRTAGDLHELFRTRSRTPIPQSLTYLIDDVARRHGRLRGGSTTSFLRCDDPALIAEVAAHPAAPSWRLRKLAPTVLISALPLLDLLDELRAAGFAPAAEGTDGQIVDLRATGRRVETPTRAARRPVGVRAADPEQLADIVRTMRAGDRAAESRRSRPVSPSGANLAEVMDLLKEAIETGRSVWVGLVDAHGVATQRVLKPLRMGGGVVEGHDPTGTDVHRLPIHRINTAAMVEE
ncbi:helicase-associated domain-containing protein [Actinokineospora sp. HUAS TT18]|uniref:helicase-associated domain-containing protein n=1 Tax=Actinokineospora sp. HUAS TT18 TaxID=3447451 RepID=UPI003F51B6A4